MLLQCHSNITEECILKLVNVGVDTYDVLFGTLIDNKTPGAAESLNSKLQLFFFAKLCIYFYRKIMQYFDFRKRFSKVVYN